MGMKKSLIFSFTLYAVVLAVVPVFVANPVALHAQGIPGPGNPSDGIPGRGNPNGGITTIPNPLNSNYQDVTSFVVAVLQNIVLPIGVVIVVFMLIYAGYLFVTAQGNETKVSEAKKTFLYVVIGAAILLGSIVIAKAVKNTVCQIAPAPWCQSSLGGL